MCSWQSDCRFRWLHHLPSGFLFSLSLNKIFLLIALLCFSCSLVFSCWFSLIRILSPHVRKWKQQLAQRDEPATWRVGDFQMDLSCSTLIVPSRVASLSLNFSNFLNVGVQIFFSYDNLQLRSDLIEVHLCQQKEPWLDDTWSLNLRSVLSDKSGSPPTEQQVKFSGFETTTKEVVSNLFLLISASSSSDPAQMLWNRVKAENLPRPQKRQSPRKLLSGDCIQKEISANQKWKFHNIFAKSFLILGFQECNIENCPGEDEIEMCRTWFSLQQDFHRTQVRSLPWPLSYWLTDSLC